MSTVIRATWLFFPTLHARHCVYRNTACWPCPPDRTDRPSAAAPVTSDKLVWLSDAVMRADGARTTRKHDQTSIVLSLSWLVQHASRCLYIPVTATVWMWLLPSWHWNLHVSHAGVAHSRLWLLPPLQGLPVHGPCVLFPHRWEGRSPPSLETACKWIMWMPLIYSQSQSAAAHLQCNDCVKCTGVFSLISVWANREIISLFFFFLNLNALFKWTLVQSVCARSHN